MEIRNVTIETDQGNVTVTVTDMGQALMVACSTALIHKASIDELSKVITRALKIVSDPWH